MSSQAKGLRFDLFERVHVPPFLPAISALDEMELVPEIECMEENGMVVMRGHFRFSVDYLVMEAERETIAGGAHKHRLEHMIPVDITLPRQRIARMEDVQVVIETYDTEHIDERELNLNVIIELRGISKDVVQTSPSPSLEEHVFADEDANHHAQEIAMPMTSATRKKKKQTPVAQPLEVDEPTEEMDAEETEETEETGQTERGESWPDFIWPGEEQPPPPTFPDYANRAPIVEDDPQFSSDDDDVFVEPPRKKRRSKVSSTQEILESPKFQEESHSADLEILEVMQPIQSQTQAPPIQSSLRARESVTETFHQKETRETTMPVQRPTAIVVPPSQTVADDVPLESSHSLSHTSSAGLEWTRSFLRERQAQSNTGRKRMCIVQKEESLDTIATRYGIHAQELVMFNRLSDRQLHAGQILYIPLSG